MGVNNPHSLVKKAALNVAGVTGIDASGILDLDELGDAVLDPAVDSIVFIDEATSGDPSKLELVSDFVDAIRGTAATTGLTSSSGVLLVAARIAHFVADQASSLFFDAIEIDCGVATAVDTKVTDAAEAKGKLIAALGIVTEAFNGDADSTIVISKAASGATAMASTITVDKDAAAAGNWVGAVFGAAPVSGADAIVAAAGDVYAYSAANTNRATGKMYILLVFQVTA